MQMGVRTYLSQGVMWPAILGDFETNINQFYRAKLFICPKMINHAFINHAVVHLWKIKLSTTLHQIDNLAEIDNLIDTSEYLKFTSDIFKSITPYSSIASRGKMQNDRLIENDWPALKGT